MHTLIASPVCLLALLLANLAYGQSNPANLVFDFSPGLGESKNRITLTAKGQTFDKIVVFPKLNPIPLNAHPIHSTMNSYLLAAASANREALLSLWHSAERGYATGIYSDEKALVTMATAVNSIDAFYVTGIIEYGDDYTFALGLQRYRDRTFRAVVFPFKQDGKRLALTNDLKNDPAFASFAQLAATKLKNDFLRKYPETAQ